jgi:hypothetical protein
VLTPTLIGSGTSSIGLIQVTILTNETIKGTFSSKLFFERIYEEFNSSTILII